MNAVSMYPDLKDRRIRPVDLNDGRITAWSEEVSIVGDAATMKEFRAEAKRQGWVVVK